MNTDEQRYPLNGMFCSQVSTSPLRHALQKSDNPISSRSIYPRSEVWKTHLSLPTPRVFSCNIMQRRRMLRQHLRRGRSFWTGPVDRELCCDQKSHPRGSDFRLACSHFLFPNVAGRLHRGMTGATEKTGSMYLLMHIRCKCVLQMVCCLIMKLHSPWFNA